MVRSRCLYKVKQAIDGSVEKHNARLVARVFTQQPRVETSALVERMDTIITVLAIVAKNWPFYQMDVKSTFLNGILKEEFI